MQQIVILLVISSPSTCFGRLYAHRQEVRLRFHCLWFSALLWLLWCWRFGWQAVWQATYSTQCTQPASRLSNITTVTTVTTGQKTTGSENAVWPPDDGRKDARNMLRDYWLPIKSLFVASSWSHLYLREFSCLSRVSSGFFLADLFRLILHVWRAIDYRVAISAEKLFFTRVRKIAESYY